MEFDDFLRSACPPLDLRWRKYRRRASRHRVRARMGELGLHDYATYLDYLQAHADEAASLADLMRVTVSRFLRERACWLDLFRSALPPALESLPAGTPFRAWSAGCCGGEEPYSLVILWRDTVSPSVPEVELEVTATDIDCMSLERAAGGLFLPSSLREITKSEEKRWFHREGTMRRIDDGVQGAVAFRERNLADGPLSQKQDLVLCRYLAFTYYRGRRRLEAARTLCASLREGGLLFIGRKEGLGREELELFEPLAAGCGIYRKRRSV